MKETQSMKEPQAGIFLCEVNEFDETFYNGPKTEHFITRLNLMHEAAIEGFRRNNLTYNQQELQDIKDFYTQKSVIASNLSKNNFSTSEFDGTTPEMNDANQKFFIDGYDKGKKLLQDAFRDFERELKSKGVNKERLVDLEKEVVLKRNRPLIINKYKIPGVNRTFVSIQNPIFDVTNPSSIRNREGLCTNAAFSLSGYIDDEGKIVITSEASRHSSPPPITEPDKYIRQKITAQNVKQEINEIVKSKVDPSKIPANNSEQSPIEIDWNNMILLTTKKIDALRNKISGGCRKVDRKRGNFDV